MRNNTVRKILTIQLTLTLTAMVLSFFLLDFRAAYSACVGGGISVITTAYFAYKVFSAKPGTSAQQVARTFYMAEVIKILLTAVLFIIVLLWFNVSFLPLFLTYAVTLLAYWLVLPFTSADSSMRTP